MKIFQKFEVDLRFKDTFKHAHPWKIVQYDNPKGVTVLCFHFIFVIPFIYGTRANIILIYFFKKE